MVMRDGRTRVDSVSESGVVFEPSAVAVLLTNPASPAAAVGLTTMVTVAVPLGAMVPKLQVTVPLLAPSASVVHVPSVLLTATNVVLAGMDS